MKVTNILSKTLCIYDRQVLAHTQGGMGVNSSVCGGKGQGWVDKKIKCGAISHAYTG